MKYGSSVLQHVNKYTDTARQVLARCKPVEISNQNPFFTSLLKDILLLFFPFYFFYLMGTLKCSLRSNSV